MVSWGNIRSWVIANRVILTLLSIILLGSFLRIYDLGDESLWLDEAGSVVGSKGSLGYIVESSGRLHNQPPLYFILLHFWMLLFGTSEIAVRSLSAIFGIISIVLIYQIGCQLFNRKVGLISSFLSAISYYHIYYSQEARGYSLLLLLTLLSFLLFIKALRTDNKRGLYFVLLLLANICLAYTHTFGLFVIMSQIFYFLLFWNKYKQLRFWFFGVQITTVALFSPWIPTFFERVSRLSPGFWIPEPSLMSIIDTVGVYSGGFKGYGSAQILLAVVFSILCLIGLFSIKAKIKRLNSKWTWRRPVQSIKRLSRNISLESVEEILLLLIWFSFPIIIPFVLSQFLTPIYTTRYTISASAAFYLLAAKGVSTFDNRKALLYSLVIIIALLSLPGLHRYYTHDVKEQWREATDFIEYNTRAEDAIIICADYAQRPFDYYYGGDLERFGIGRGVEEINKIAAVVDNASAGKERLWLVLSHAEGTPIRDYLIERYGSGSVAVEKRFVGIRVSLFDLQVESL